MEEKYDRAEDVCIVFRLFTRCSLSFFCVFEHRP